jgi:hypothetical protein
MDFLSSATACKSAAFVGASSADGLSNSDINGTDHEKFVTML